MNYVLGILILAFWIYVAMGLSWDPKASVRANLIIGFGAIILMGIIYWVPFWLIFLK